MKVILIENVKGTGKKDEIKEVKDGYGTFLIKNKKAVMATQKSKEVLDVQIKDRLEKEEQIIKESNILKEKIEKLSLTFKVKTSQNGKVFGSVTTKQIVEELKKKNIIIDKKTVDSDNLNTIGIHIIKINLHKEVTANLKITIEGGA